MSKSSVTPDKSYVKWTGTSQKDPKNRIKKSRQPPVINKYSWDKSLVSLPTIRDGIATSWGKICT